MYTGVRGVRAVRSVNHVQVFQIHSQKMSLPDKIEGTDDCLA